jgi:tetratricopeptide (TPR) repeat protein
LSAAQELALAHFQIAKVLDLLGQTNDAIESCDRALTIQRPIADKKGTSLTSRNHLSQMDEFIAELLARAGRGDDACAAAMRARKIVEDSMGLKRQHVGHLPQISDVDHALGIAKRAAGQLDQALADLQLEVEARTRLDESGARLATDQTALSIALLTLAETQQLAGKTAEAEATLRHALDRTTKLVAATPNAKRTPVLLARIEVTLAELLSKNGKAVEMNSLKTAARARIEPIAQAVPSFAEARELLNRAK